VIVLACSQDLRLERGHVVAGTLARSSIPDPNCSFRAMSNRRCGRLGDQ
jgi:hypothetical protein